MTYVALKIAGDCVYWTGIGKDKQCALSLLLVSTAIRRRH